MKPHYGASVIASGAHLPIRMEDPFTSVIGADHDRANDAASTTRTDMITWRPPRRSADADILPDLDTMVGRSRDGDRNQPIARGIRQTIVDNVIGTGPRLSSRPDYLALGKDVEWAIEWGAKLESWFNTWWWSPACHAGASMGGDQMVQVSLGAQIMNGDAILLPQWITDRGDGFSTKLQLVEADRLSNPAGRPNTQKLRGGIEFDDYGAPTAYWIRKTHPGDFLVNGFGGYMNDWERIPARTDFGRRRVLHMFDPERPGQSRGKPSIAAIIPELKQVDRYKRAELDAAVVNAKIAGLIETPMSESSILDLFNGDHAKYMDARNDFLVRLVGGSLIPLFPGDKLSPFLPQRPNAAFGQFVENVLRIAGCGADLPYELISKDFSKTTYTSGRMALLEAWRGFNRKRDLVGTNTLDPILDLLLEELVDNGAIDAPGFMDNPMMRRAYLRCAWIWPGRGWVDPAKEADAAGKRMQYGISTLRDECAELGKDWREQLDQAAIEAAYRVEKGLPAPVFGAAPSGGGSGAPNGSDPADPADPADPQDDTPPARQPQQEAA